MAAKKEAVAKTAPVKAEEVKAPVKKAEVKAEPAKKVEVKAEVKPEVKAEVKAEAKKAPVEKKAPAKKETAKKAPAEKKAPAKKAEVKAALHVQFAGKSLSEADLVKMAQDVWTYDMGMKAEDFKTVELYVKPEESVAYFVVNGEFTGSFMI